MDNLEIIGRSSSHFTRMALIFAEELSVPCRLIPIYDMVGTSAEVYAGNPALKLPILRTGGSVLFGAQNICRAIAARAVTSKRIVWPEELHEHVSCNAQELVWHCMATQVQVVMGTTVNKLPADNPYFVKAQISLEGSLRWLDSNLAAALRALPPRDLSLFEVSLHCLVTHIVFRSTLPVEPYRSLLGFCAEFAMRSSAERTVYRIGVPQVA